MHLRNFHLPYTKQRWISAACLLPNGSDLLVCGDRGGTIQVYDMLAEVWGKFMSCVLHVNRYQFMIAM